VYIIADMDINSADSKILSVSGVNKLIKLTLENEPLLSEIRVRGEISNFTRHASGHLYFSLKDANAQIRSVMFMRNAGALKFRPEDGLEVIADGSIGVFEKRGEYQLYVRDMQPAGVGALYLQFEKLKQKLQKEGLFDPDRKKEIPKFPRRIAVVTSPTGAAVRDVINIITRRFPAIDIIVVPALVQGADAPASIIAALKRALALLEIDTILLVRGGGSIEDLWGFNDENLAREIAAAKIPIISGVGHETDFTIADFAADLRAPTPSAAAEIAVPDMNELRMKLDSIHAHLLRRLTDLARYYRSRLETSSVKLSTDRILDFIDRRRELLDDYSKNSKKNLLRMVDTHRRTVSHLEEKLAAIDPRRVLARGFSICEDHQSGKLIRSVAQIKQSTVLRVTLQDGAIVAKPDLKTNPAQKLLDLE